MTSISISGLHDIERAAGEFIRLSGNRTKFAFYGPMGSGKTTFIKAVCRAMGAADLVTSPTFTLVNEYHTSGEKLIYHFDLYRIQTVSELYDLGYEEYFWGPHVLFIEWPEQAESLLPEETLRVYIEQTGETERMIHAEW